MCLLRVQLTFKTVKNEFPLDYLCRQVITYALLKSPRVIVSTTCYCKFDIATLKLIALTCVIVDNGQFKIFLKVYPSNDIINLGKVGLSCVTLYLYGGRLCCSLHTWQ